MSQKQRSLFELLEERVLGIPAEVLAAADAELEAERADPSRRPQRVEWRDDPDPFGMDWRWAGRPKDDAVQR